MPSVSDLSFGALETIMQGGEIKDPIMQVLGNKKMPSGNPESERYRVLLSDGKYTVSNAIVTLSNPSTQSVKNFSVIQIKRYMTSMLKEEKRVLVIMDWEVVCEGGEVGAILGQPSALNVSELAQNTNARSGSVNQSFNSTNYNSNRAMPSTSMENGHSNIAQLSTQITHPISSLSPYQNKWVIKARVSNKSAMRTWSNSKGEGKLFSFDLIDESGEIRCTAFRDQADKFYDKIEIDKVYYISRCQLKPANKQFSNLKNEYEMTVGNETIIEECSEDDVTAIPQTKYDFIPIDKIAHNEAGTIVDVLAVAKSTSELVSFQAKSTGRELKKRDVVLIDQSKVCVSLTLWGAEAEAFNGASNPVVVIKSAKIGEFGGGKTLSTMPGSHLKINPETQEAYSIKSWFDKDGKHLDPTNISATSGVIGSFSAQWLSFKQVQEQNLGNQDRGDYYQTMATILLFRGENCFYKACPSENCNKKVVDMENGMYRCEKCNREYSNFKYRLLVSMNVGDWSGNQWVNMFSAEAEKILGMTADEVGTALEQNQATTSEIGDKAHFKQFIFKCRAKMETYNDEARLKTVVVKVDSINYEEYNAHLIQDINQLLSLSS